MIWLALAIAAVALVVLGTRTPLRPRDLTPEELEAARETEALTPGTPAWQRLDAPEWLKREGEKGCRDIRTFEEIEYRAIARLSIPMVVVPRDPEDAEVARQLTEFMRSPEIREKFETEVYNRLKYGPDEKGWPS